MSPETAIERGDPQQRLSGLGFIGRAILIIVGSLLLPRASNLAAIMHCLSALSENPAHFSGAEL
jgi:hypothetical protein